MKNEILKITGCIQLDDTEPTAFVNTPEPSWQPDRGGVYGECSNFDFSSTSLFL